MGYPVYRIPKREGSEEGKKDERGRKGEKIFEGVVKRLPQKSAHPGYPGIEISFLLHPLHSAYCLLGMGGQAPPLYPAS
jgi:hypothetical protein